MIETLACIFSVLVVGIALYVFGSVFIGLVRGIMAGAQVRGTQCAQDGGYGESWGSGWSDGSYSWDGGCDWGDGGGCDWGGGGGDGGCGGDG